ncbi:MAG: SH3 domain-containing protein [Sphingopyxis sp.]|nr:SH3 domain-containing protein [Sphingopyxis sp.]
MRWCRGHLPGRVATNVIRSLNCRSSNSLDASVVKSFGNDNSVKVIEERDGWSRLNDSTGCWVA